MRDGHSSNRMNKCTISFWESFPDDVRSMHSTCEMHQAFTDSTREIRPKHSECAWHHNRTYVFDIWASKTAPKLCILTSKSVSRHSCLQFLISNQVVLPPSLWQAFFPTGATKHWEKILCRDFSSFLRSLIFFLILDCSHNSCRICPQFGSLISKLLAIDV